MTRGAKPYLVPDPSAATFGTWMLRTGGGWETLGDQIVGWDSWTDLEIRRDVQVDLVRMRAEAGLPGPIPLKLTVSWTSSSTQMSGVATQQTLPSSGVAVVDALLPGGQVGGVLDINTTLTVSTEWEAPAGMAHEPGAILLANTWRLALEGTGSLFPVSVVDFSHTMFDPDASWHLTTSTDLEAPFLGRFLLSVNTRDRELMEAVSAKVRTPRQDALVTDLHHGVAQLILRLAQEVNLGDPLSERDWPADSVGDILSRTLGASDLLPPVSTAEPDDLSMRRSQVEGSTRRSGHGRVFR